MTIRPIPETMFRNKFSPPLPATHAKMYCELEWYATDNDRLLGTVVLDKTDQDYSWVILSRDAQGKYRAAALEASLPTQLLRSRR